MFKLIAVHLVLLRLAESSIIDAAYILSEPVFSNKYINLCPLHGPQGSSSLRLPDECFTRDVRVSTASNLNHELDDKKRPNSNEISRSCKRQRIAEKAHLVHAATTNESTLVTSDSNKLVDAPNTQDSSKTGSQITNKIIMNRISSGLLFPLRFGFSFIRLLSCRRKYRIPRETMVPVIKTHINIESIGDLDSSNELASDCYVTEKPHEIKSIVIDDDKSDDLVSIPAHTLGEQSPNIKVEEVQSPEPISQITNTQSSRQPVVHRSTCDYLWEKPSPAEIISSDETNFGHSRYFSEVNAIF